MTKAKNETPTFPSLRLLPKMGSLDNTATLTQAPVTKHLPRLLPKKVEKSFTEMSRFINAVANSTFLYRSGNIRAGVKVSSSGRETIYALKARATYPRAILRYQSDPAFHSNVTEGTFNKEAELLEFEDYLVDTLEERNISVRRKGLEIEVSRK